MTQVQITTLYFISLSPLLSVSYTYIWSYDNLSAKELMLLNCGGGEAT